MIATVLIVAFLAWLFYALAVGKMNLTPRQQRLADAFRAAKTAAEAVRGDGDDGGTANLDSAFLYARRGLTDAGVRRAAEAAGVSVGSKSRSHWWNGWFVHLGAGQGAMRTRMAEAASTALRDAGEEASVYYAID